MHVLQRVYVEADNVMFGYARNGKCERKQHMASETAYEPIDSTSVHVFTSVCKLERWFQWCSQTSDNTLWRNIHLWQFRYIDAYTPWNSSILAPKHRDWFDFYQFWRTNGTTKCAMSNDHSIKSLVRCCLTIIFCLCIQNKL